MFEHELDEIHSRFPSKLIESSMGSNHELNCIDLIFEVIEG